MNDEMSVVKVYMASWIEGRKREIAVHWVVPGQGTRSVVDDFLGLVG